MIGSRSFNKRYQAFTSSERYKALTLLFILIAGFLFCLFFSIKEIVTGIFFTNPGFYIIAIISPILAWFLYRGHYKVSVYASIITITLAISYSQLVGEYREIEILDFILIITFCSLYTNRRFSISIMLYSLLYIIVLYLVKSETQDFSAAYLPFSIFFFILISSVGILNSWILDRNINEITEEVLKRTAELNKSKDYAELLFRHNPSAVYTVDHTGRILDFNRKAEELTGYSKNEIVGMNETILEPLDEKSLAEYHSDKSTESVGTLISKDGKEKTIARYSALITDEMGVINGKIVSFTDLTEWRELERYKADMERVIRHDLKTPLNSVIGFPSLMLDDEEISSEHKEYLSIIRNAGLTMRRLIESSRSLYQIEEGTYEPDPEPTDLFLILGQIRADLSDLITRKKAGLRIFLDGNPVDDDASLTLVTEKLLLHMILANLIKNALEASPQKGNVTLSIETSPSLSISVHNRGIIPEAIRETFFKKYVTLNKKSGTGLGTYSAKIMSQAIGADLAFTTGEKDGTFLKLTFPA